MNNPHIILPGATIGIIDGGQLGKMLAMAAAQFGYKTIVWCQDRNDPAAQVTTHLVLGPYDDAKAGRRFLAHRADVMTYAFENLPIDKLEELFESRSRDVYPSFSLLRIAQDRLDEKKFFSQIGIPTTPTIPISTLEDTNVTLFNTPAILKTRRFGYDGKGQIPIKSLDEIPRAWEQLNCVPCVLEEKVEFAYEMSVIVARNIHGRIKVYPAIENKHVNGILSASVCPSRSISAEVQELGQQMASNLAAHGKLVGICALELFVLPNGAVLANEMAPRPHNSGHGTIEGNGTSQFEQHIRAICGLELGPTEVNGMWRMVNLIGSEIEQVPTLLSQADCDVHVYGKSEVREGRKMGHYTYRPF